MEKLTISVSDTALALSVGKTTVWSLLKEGRLQAVRVRRRTLVTAASVRALIAQP